MRGEPWEHSRNGNVISTPLRNLQDRQKKLWVVSSYTEKRVTQALDVQAPRSDVRNALASPLNGSISQNNEKTMPS